MMTPEQGEAFARLMRDFKPDWATVRPNPFGLPNGYVGVTLHLAPLGGREFECGIAPNGDVSS